MADLPDQLVSALRDRYRLERELGAGGMATVYLARDLRHDRAVAVKVLRPELAAVIGAERFLQEIKTTANLQHPHILPLHDSGQVNGTVFYVMPYVEGESLRDRLSREKQLPINEAVRIATEVAGALDYAHRHGVIHRDIKPENILLHDGRAVVADFGIALAASSAGSRMTGTGMSLGTPNYMSPEQAMGERAIDARTDVYALGCVLYEMLLGEPPFTGPSVQAIIAKVLSSEPEPPGRIRKTVPPAVEAAVLTALAKLPADRYRTTTEFAAALVGAPAASQPIARRATTTRSRGIAVAVVTLAAGIVIGWLVPRTQTARPVGAGARPVRLTHGGQVGCAAISADGREFAAVIGTYDEETDCSGTLIIRSVPSGVDQVAAKEARFVSGISWNPSGTALLVSGSVAGKAKGLWVLPRGVGAPRQLSAEPASAFGFIDERRVYIADGRTIRILDAESGETRDSLQLPWSVTGNAAFAWSPSGDRFATSRSDFANRGLFLVSARGQVTDSLLVNVNMVTWLGEGRIAYYVNRAFGPGDILTHSVNPRSGRFAGEASILWAALPATRSYSASRVGNRFMVVIRPVVDEQHIVNLDTPTLPRVRVRSLNAYLGDPHLSPDGSRIAYTREDALGFNAYWVARDSGPEHPISNDTLNAIGTNWLGSHQVATQSRLGALTVVDLDNGRIRRVSQPSALEFYDAAGNTWIWTRVGEPYLVAHDSLGREIRQVGKPPQLRAIQSGRIDPAASRLVVVGPSTDQRMIMSTYLFATGEWSAPVTVAPSSLRVAGVSSRGVVYFSQFTDRTEIWVSRDPASLPALLARLPIHCYDESVIVSDDGKTVVCNVTTSQPDAWLVDVPGDGR